jgi:hypothetical protein
MRLRRAMLLLKKRSTSCKVLDPFPLSLCCIHLSLLLGGDCSFGSRGCSYTLAFLVCRKAFTLVCSEHFINFVILCCNIRPNRTNGSSSSCC